MGLSSAVGWWEEWQLRILVLGSQSIQWLLFLSARRRKSIVSSPVRLLIWLAYIGSDAVAIYALAALFNRHKKQGDSSVAKDESVLEVVWAPVLLMHLGGQDCITAYNMEDNELWRRHVLTALSQLTVSIYVFCKSWRGGDKKLLQAAIMLFTLGGIRCLEKPLALQKASINSLASSSETTAKPSDYKGSNSKINSLEGYVKKVGALYQAADRRTEAQGGADVEAKHLSDKAQAEDDVEANRLSDKAQVEDDVEANRRSDKARVEDEVEANRPSDRARVEGDVEANPPSETARVDGDVEANHPSDKAQVEGDVEASHLYDKAQVEDDVETNRPSNKEKREVDSTDHQRKKNYFSHTQAEDQVNKLFVDLASPYRDRVGVTESFLELDGETAYLGLQRRLSNTFDLLYTKAKIAFPSIKDEDNFFVVLAQWFRFACIILPFAAIGLFDRSHREAYDPKDVKVTYTLLCCTAVMELISYKGGYGSRFSGMVAQYSFMGYFARNKKYSKRMSILSSLNFKEYVDRQWSMKPTNSSSRITILVHQQVKGWWKQHIQDAADYTKFNNHRGQWTIEQKGCSKLIGWSVKRSFDESVLLWHIATDLCFYDMGVRSGHYTSAAGCREISNYMMYLLFAKPEMLMAGTRRTLLIAAYGQLNSMLDSKEQPPVDERAVAERLIAKVEELPKRRYLVHEAWGLAKSLLDLNDEKKMWEAIEGVWLEMLCYSASRCRGYLHAKSLGTGGELLTFVWLLWSHMGMETLAERMQMPDEEQMPGEELPNEEENGNIVELIGPLIDAGSLVLDIMEETNEI